MKPDKDFKVPEGFEPVPNYINGHEAFEPGVAKLSFEAGDVFIFDISDSVPKLPIKHKGKIWHEGWDIPTLYIIDTNNIPWINDAHGGFLQKTTAQGLIFLAENEGEQNKLRKQLGLELPMPQWAETALKEGWTPPENWTWKK